MIITQPYAALVASHGNTQDSYYIRFNAVCGKMFDGAKFCFVTRTSDLAYIIIKISKTQMTRTKETSAVYRDKSGGTRLPCMRLVQSKLLPERIFGRKYRVKKDSKGNLYICLREPIEEQPVGGKEEVRCQA